MTCSTLVKRVRIAPLPLLLLVAGIPTACGLLDVSDPTKLLDSELNNAEGAELLRRDALRALYEATGQAAWYSGLLADEFRHQAPIGSPTSDELLDQRGNEEYQQVYREIVSYTLWQQLWIGATPVALTKLRAYALPGAREAH